MEMCVFAHTLTLWRNWGSIVSLIYIIFEVDYDFVSFMRVDHEMVVNETYARGLRHKIFAWLLNEASFYARKQKNYYVINFMIMAW